MGCWAAASAALPASRLAAAPVGQPTRRRRERPTETWPPWLGARRGSRRTRRWICPRLRRGERPGGRPGRWGGNGSWSGRSPRRSLGEKAQWGEKMRHSTAAQQTDLGKIILCIKNKNKSLPAETGVLGDRDVPALPALELPPPPPSPPPPPGVAEAGQGSSSPMMWA